jgi:hypothetical protein
MTVAIATRRPCASQSNAAAKVSVSSLMILSPDSAIATQG